jgi:hypothetical protein
MNTYFTGLLTTSYEVEKSPEIKGAGWSISFAEGGDTSLTKHSVNREVLIRASSWATAQKALNLIESSLSLYRGQSTVADLIAHTKDESSDDPFAGGDAFWTNGVPIACNIAARASWRKEWMYALSKYKFSIRTYSVFHIDLYPGAEHLPVSPLPDEHIMFSHAIVATYSVLEELQLEIRASAKKPSKMKDGTWNPPVKSDLERRLAKAGINLNEPLLWTVRGPIRRLETHKPITAKSKAPWSRGLIRDVEIDLIDAIAHASWLRSTIASHSVKELTKTLSPYDVVNVQHLARRIILEVLGVWPIQEGGEE